jgi:hypothetical protein
MFNVYVAEYSPQGENRAHHALFIETISTDVGTIIQVMGDKRQIMWVDVRDKCLTGSARYQSKTFIGVINDVDTVCNFCTEHVPASNPDKRNDDGSFRDCQDWVTDAINALKNAQLLF